MPSSSRSVRQGERTAAPRFRGRTLDDRLQLLRSWLDDVLDAPIDEIRTISSDASFRRYFRVHVGGRNYIAMDAPPSQYDARNYVRISARFRQIGLNVPRVLHSDPGQGFLLLTDLGGALYLARLNERTVERLYGDAMGALRLLQGASHSDKRFLPDYDEGLLLAEMRLFHDWYLQRHLGLSLTRRQSGVLEDTFTRLVERALAQPQVWVHRDYHSRNLLVTEEHNPGIVDFQDAVRGPVTYDLVSLLRDCYIAWPRPRVERWVADYHAAALPAGIPVGETPSEFLSWFDWMGVQRQLKAVGIFARLLHRDGKAGYVADIPRTLGYVFEVSARYQELQALHRLLCELKLPGDTATAGAT
jgi:aminoglycoside/choline kinase family phosphotransferase